jgi:hypothetical protein
MKKKNLIIGTMALCAALFLMPGCSPDGETRSPVPIPAVLVKEISIAGVKLDPLPQSAASIATAVSATVVVNTERPPQGENETEDNFYYRPAQPIVVTLANENQAVYFNVTRPGEEPYEITLGPNTKEGATATRTIGITLPNDDGFQVGQTVWIRVVAANESKTEYYKIEVANQTHDVAVNSITVGGYDVLDLSQTGHIGPWLAEKTWADAVAGLVNLKQSEISGVTTVVTPRNNQFPLAKPTIEYAKILANADSAVEPAAWSATAPGDFANHDILALKVTASNGKNVGYMLVTINVGGSPFLASLTVNSIAISLGSPGDSPAGLGGAYRVEEGQSLTATPVSWTVSPVAEDSNATVSWALVAKDVTPQDSDFTNPTDFSDSRNYLYIRVVSQSGEFTMYYLVVYDERPKNTEHIRTGVKNVPVYKFTIPDGKTWAVMGNYPKLRIKILQEEDEYAIGDGYQRNFTFGELSRFGLDSWDPDNFYIRTGGSGFNVYMPYLLNRRVQDFAIDTPAPNKWFTIEWPLNNPPEWRPPWNPTGSRPDIISSYNADYWPDDATTGDGYFGAGITFDGQREYWIQEIYLVSEDGTEKIFCDLLGDGRIDSNSQSIGFVEADPNGKEGSPPINFIRELVADPTLK